MIVFMRYFFSSPPSMSGIQPPAGPQLCPLPCTQVLLTVRRFTIRQSAGWGLGCNLIVSRSHCFQTFQTTLSFPLFPPGISSLRPVRGRHRSSARPPPATPWRRGRFTPRRRVLCQGTACPGGRSSSRSRPNTAPGSAPL